MYTERPDFRFALRSLPDMLLQAGNDTKAGQSLTPKGVPAIATSNREAGSSFDSNSGRAKENAWST
jgi:hypothetical protein